MPKRYEAMRDEFISQGMSEKDAKTKAAKIYNGTRKKDEPPLTNHPDSLGETRDRIKNKGK